MFKQFKNQINGMLEILNQRILVVLFSVFSLFLFLVVFHIMDGRSLSFESIFISFLFLFLVLTIVFTLTYAKNLAKALDKILLISLDTQDLPKVLTIKEARLLAIAKDGDFEDFQGIKDYFLKIPRENCPAVYIFSRKRKRYERTV